MLLFVDESGQDHRQMPCEVLAGVAIREGNYWNLIKALRSAEKDCFGDYLRNLRVTEIKARKLLKRRIFHNANQALEIPDSQLAQLANSFLVKGIQDHKSRRERSSCTREEFVGYGRTILKYIHTVLDIAANHDVKILASIVDADAALSERTDILHKNFTYLFERYFYLLKDNPHDERGLVVFDEIEKSKAQKLVQQMASYFLGTETGRFRSSRIIPEPFFVHSELTTGVFLADLTAYVLGWGWRLQSMPQPFREELKLFAGKLHDMQFIGNKEESDSQSYTIHGIKYIDDLRGRYERS
ncbi:MAG: DUF3800 domain-containing protein [Sedimentisphaerales bacterium]|nr:DUF3800 domain-containing protein [Sedimentisphaerales bacterium]